MILRVDTNGEVRRYAALRSGLSGKPMIVEQFENDSADPAERKAAAKAWCLKLKPPSADRLFLQELARSS